jgi:hypothetical protein
MRTIIALGAAVIVGLVAYLGWHYEYGTEHNVTFTVKSLDDQSSGSSHKYLVFTTNDTVYQDTDSFLHGKQDSSNIYAWLTVGDTYECPVYGYRNFFASSYEDILDGCRDITPGVAANLQTVP